MAQALNGRYNQVKGDFPAGVDLLADGGAISNKTPETDRPILTKIGILVDPGTRIIINGAEVYISDYGVLQLDEVVQIRSLIFPDGASGQIDFIY